MFKELKATFTHLDKLERRSLIFLRKRHAYNSLCVMDYGQWDDKSTDTTITNS